MAINLLCCDTVTTPIFDQTCKPTPRKGGIPYIGYINCAIEFTDITSTEEWENAIAGGQAGLFPVGIGSKPETDKVNRRLQSCGGEIPVFENHVINFRSYQADLINNSDFPKWNTIKKEYNNFLFFYIDCEGNIYTDLDNDSGFVPKSFVLDHITEETNEDTQFMQIVLTFELMGLVIPFKNPAIINALKTASGSN